MKLEADGDFWRAGVRDRGVFFTAAGVEFLECVEGWRVRLGGATWPCGLWAGRLQRDGDLAEQIGLGAGGGEGQTDARDGFDDASAQLQQPEPDGGELGLGQGMGLGNGVTDSEHQPVGCGMEHEANLVGDRRSATCAVGGKLALVHFDEVLGLTAGAVDHVIDVLGRSLSDVGHDEADIEA